MIRCRRTAVLLVAVTLAGCTARPHPPAPTPAPSPVAPAPSPSAGPGQDAVDAYVRLQRAFLRAGQSATLDDPDLARYGTGEALHTLRNILATYRAQGLRTRGEAVFHATVESVGSDTTRVRDCLDTRGTSVYRPSGEPYADAPGGLRLVLADVVLVDGVWKVTLLDIRAIGSCTV